MDGMTIIGIALRPLVAFALFFGAAVIGRAILRRLPSGPIKRFLGRRMPVIPRTEAERKDWWPVFWLWLAIVLLYGGIAYSMRGYY